MNHYQKYKSYYQNYYREYMRNHKNDVSFYRQRIKLEVLVHYGGNPPKCACCGETHIEFLTIDHIHGDGAKHRKEMFKYRYKSGTSFYQWLKKNNYPEGYQVLCYNCNCAKRNLNRRFCLVHHPELVNQ